MSKLTKNIGKSIVATMLAGLLVSWRLPSNYHSLQEPSDKSLQLDYVILQINGETKKINGNEEISFVRGDLIKVKEAYLKDSKKAINLLAIMGAEESNQALNEIRKRELDSSRELVQREGTLDPQGTVYALVAQSGGLLHGAIFLRRIEPTLSHIDIQVNGKARVMREGESLQVKKSDRYKVVNVVTNIRDSKEVSFAVVPVIGAKSNDNYMQHYQIVFRNKDYVFAKIPLTVEGL